MRVSLDINGGSYYRKASTKIAFGGILGASRTFNRWPHKPRARTLYDLPFMEFLRAPLLSHTAVSGKKLKKTILVYETLFDSNRQ